ncbi:hypothetical protein PENSPDRAFT_236279 [Peniophora sp. CONT]|nr:hypothetical protein PENSPDRAFT_236279 [Peniophora sp. CONT]
MPAGDLTTKAKRRTILKRYRRAASFVRLCVLPHPVHHLNFSAASPGPDVLMQDFTIPRSRRGPESGQRFIASKWSSQSALNGVVASSVSHRSLNSHRSRTRGRHSPPIEASGSRQFLSPHYTLGRHELERCSFPRYGELGVGAEPSHNSPDSISTGHGSETTTDRSRIRTLSEPTKVTESPAKPTTKPRSASQPVPPFGSRVSSEALNVTSAAKLLTPIMEDAPTLNANALLYPSFSSSLDAMHEASANDPQRKRDASDTHDCDQDVINDDPSTALPSVILTAATPFENGSEQPVMVFTPPTTPQKRRVSTASTETHATQNRRSDSTLYLDCDSVHSVHESPRNALPSEDGVRGRRRSSSLSEHHRRRSTSQRGGGPTRRPSIATSQHTRRSLSREPSERVPDNVQRRPSGRQSLTRRSSYESALSFSDSVALTLAYLNAHDTQDVTIAPLSRRSSRAGGLRIATDISPVLDGLATEFSPTETAVGTPRVKGKGSDRRASWADKLANKLAYLVRSPTRTRSLRLNRVSRSSALIEAPIPIPASA